MDLNVKQKVTVTNEEMNRWFVLQQQMKAIREEEMELRQKIFAAYFENAEEGTNNHTLPDGFILKGKRVVNRSVDKAALNVLAEDLRKADVNVDELIEWKPSLKLSAYRKLNKDQIWVVDQVLVVKDGSPSLEIVAPKDRK